MTEPQRPENARLSKDTPSTPSALAVTKAAFSQWLAHRREQGFDAQLAKFERLVRAEERERCARIAYSEGKEFDRADSRWLAWCEHLAEIIRESEERTPHE